MNNKLSYPIELYPQQSRFISALVLVLVIVLLVFFMVLARHNWIFLFMLFALLIVAVMALFSLIIHKPSVILHHSGIELCYFLKQDKQLLWSEIEHIELNKRSSGKTTFWQLTIIPKQAFDKEITHTIRKMTYEDLLLNEKEIFAIIKQSFYGKPPIYQQIDMSFVAEFKDKFSTPEKRIKTFEDMGRFCLMMLILGCFFFGKNAYYGIEKEMIAMKDGLTYEVIVGRNSNIFTDPYGIRHHSICRNTNDRPNHICSDKFKQQKFIGKGVKFLNYYKEYHFLDLYQKPSYEGVIVSGTFINQADNKVYEVKPSAKELKSADNFYNGQMIFIRVWIFGSLLGFIISIIAIVREKSIED